jgi:8-oxo-dGTP pyrophosphatase MutT (NUDIX family)
MPKIRSTVVEVCVFKRRRKTPQYLVLRRSSTEKLYPDIWQIVTGRIRRGENTVKAALRELREETSLPVSRFWTVPLVGSFFDSKEDAIQIYPLFAAEVSTTAEPILSREHQEYKWVTLKRALNLLVWPGHHAAVQTVHSFVVSGREAARLTERIIS